MFDSLSSKLENAFKRIRGRGVLNASDIEATLKEVRMALLEADVNFKVAKDFCAKVSEKALGSEVLKSLSPDQQILKIVQEELSAVMGAEASELNLKVAPPFAIMLAGLQGSGKTTTAAKLARYLREQEKKKILLVPADVYRPAAIDQLTQLGKALNIEVFASSTNQDPVTIATEAKAYAANHAFDGIIIDTAGRLQIDTELMQELKQISAAVSPQEILLVVDAMTGQEAVNVASSFDQQLSLSGLVLSKLDGDARGGAALSIRAVTGKPIKFIGVGEKSDALELFHPQRMASRILGMGDVMTLIEKAVKEVNVEESLKLQKKMRKNGLSFDDFLNQLRMIRKMGSISSLAAMIPGMGKLTKDIDPEHAEKEMKRVEAIILSMTRQERDDGSIINGSRRRRIALGSGTSVEEVNRLLKQFNEMKKMMKQISGMGLGNMAGMLGGKGMGALSGLFKGMK